MANLSLTRTRNRVFIPAFRFWVSVGAAAAGLASARYPSMGFADGAVNQVNWNTDDDELVDLGWGAFSVSIIHQNPNAGTGNVMLTLTTSAAADGGDMTTGDSVLLANQPVAAAAQNIRGSATLAASVAVVPTRTRHFRLSRDGTDVGDTLAGNWNVIGVVLGKVG